MFSAVRRMAFFFVALLVCLAPQALRAAPQGSEIGVVVMHGKGGSPAKFVSELAGALEREGFQVANLEMPWSGRRHYDVDLNAGVDEVSRALDGLRAKGARKVFLAGHSQGGLFALLYGGLHAVDGIAAIAPGGQVDANAFVRALGAQVSTARRMVQEGRGNEKAEFADFEGSRGTSTITTTAASYQSWFDPDGAHTSRVFAKVKPGTPVLYVSPTRDYPALLRGRDRNFGSLPSNSHTRIVEPDADHLHSPGAASSFVIAWIQEVVGR